MDFYYTPKSKRVWELIFFFLPWEEEKKQKKKNAIVIYQLWMELHKT